MMKTALLAFTLFLSSTVAGFTASLEMPKGEVILTVSGDIGVTNDGETASFDREMLEALPTTTIRTSTIWTEGVNEFQGVSLKYLTDYLKVGGSNYKATAVNDYAVEIPVSDAVEDGPVIAYKMDGKNMSLRDKGPLWVIYPYDDNADYQVEVIYSRSIWQLDRLEATE